MRLKCIDIYGFKSFVEKTQLSLDSVEEINKNNVANAIKWVMGEQSPKSLGVTKMKDLINGPYFEEGGLTIDNSDNILQIKSSEVKIIRRVYRFRGSEFFINGISCCLKDIKGLCNLLDLEN